MRMALLWCGLLITQAGCVRAIKEQRLRTAIDELWVGEDLAVIDKYYHPAAAMEARQFMTESLSMWPDPTISVDSVVIDRTIAVVEFTVSGRHRDFDQVVTVSGVFVERIEGFKVAEEKRYFDNLAVFDQLGFQVVPPDMIVLDAAPEPTSPPETEPPQPDE